GVAVVVGLADVVAGDGSAETFGGEEVGGFVSFAPRAIDDGLAAGLASGRDVVGLAVRAGRDPLSSSIRSSSSARSRTVSGISPAARPAAVARAAPAARNR